MFADLNNQPMHRRISVSVMVLSAVMIASCATNRIHEARKSDLACKTPHSNYEYGRNLPTRAIRSNNRKYARISDRTSWNKTRYRLAERKSIRPVNEKDAAVTSKDRSRNINLAGSHNIDQQTNDLLMAAGAESNRLIS